MSFFQNTCKPKGFAGKIMVNMMNTGHAALAEWGLTHIKIRDDDFCLDIGCGGGANLKRLLGKSSNGHITGVDYSEVSVQKSKKLNRAAIQEGRCEVLQGNVMNLPFSENTFHLVTAFETIYFWPGIQVAFQQVYRVLKNGGTFLICNESNGKNTKDEKWTDIIHGMTIYTSEQMTLITEVETAIGTVMSNSTAYFITDVNDSKGEYDPNKDADWESFVSKMKNAGNSTIRGYEALCEQYQAAYDTYLQKRAAMQQ